MPAYPLRRRCACVMAKWPVTRAMQESLGSSLIATSYRVRWAARGSAHSEPRALKYLFLLNAMPPRVSVSSTFPASVRGSVVKFCTSSSSLLDGLSPPYRGTFIQLLSPTLTNLTGRLCACGGVAAEGSRPPSLVRYCIPNCLPARDRQFMDPSLQVEPRPAAICGRQVLGNRAKRFPQSPS